jgi:hypothetical protein
MNFLRSAHKHPPEDDDEPKTPRQPGTKEPEPDIPDSDEERHVLETPVQVRSGLRPSL